MMTQKIPNIKPTTIEEIIKRKGVGLFVRTYKHGGWRCDSKAENVIIELRYKPMSAYRRQFEIIRIHVASDEGDSVVFPTDEKEEIFELADDGLEKDPILANLPPRWTHTFYFKD